MILSGAIYVCTQVYIRPSPSIRFECCLCCLSVHFITLVSFNVSVYPFKPGLDMDRIVKFLL